MQMNAKQLSIHFTLVLILVSKAPVAEADKTPGDTERAKQTELLDTLTRKYSDICSKVRLSGIKDCKVCEEIDSYTSQYEKAKSVLSSFSTCETLADKAIKREDKAEDTCKDLREKLDKARKDAVKDCSESKVSAKAVSKPKKSKDTKEVTTTFEDNLNSEKKSAEDCEKNAIECGEESGEDVDVSQYINLPGITNFTNKCPRYSSSEYKDRSSSTKSEMRDLKKELESEQKEITSDLAKKKKEIADIQKEIDELQPKLDEALQKNEGEQMKLVAESQKMENEILVAKAQIETKLIENSSAKIATNSEKASKLLEWTNDLTKCSREVTATNNQTTFNSSIIRTSGGTNSIADQKKKNTQLIQEKCVQPDMERRRSYQQIYANKMKQLDLDYSNLHSNLQSVNVQMQSARQNQEKLMSRLKEQVTKTNESFMKQRKNLLLQMQIKMTELTQLEQSSRQKQYRLQADVNNAQRELAALGVDPKGSKAEYSTAMTSARHYAAAAEDYRKYGKGKCDKILNGDDGESEKNEEKPAAGSAKAAK